MNNPLVRAYVIGQTPRPDLTADLRRRFPSTSFEVVGALDGLGVDDIRRSPKWSYPLETRLRDGTRVVVDAAFVGERLQAALDADTNEATAHLVLCAGPFTGLSVPRSGRRITAPARPPAPLIRPFDVAAQVFRRLGHARLAVLVPFEDQAAPAAAKWVGAGFAVSTHDLSQRPGSEPLPAWVADRLEGADAEAIVFDYVGFPSDQLRDVANRFEIPVYDLGHLALDALEDLLGAL